MKVNSQDASQAYLVMSNRLALEVKQPANGEEPLDHALGRLRDDVYHKYEQKEPDPTYSQSMTITSNNVLSTAETEKQALDNIWVATVNLYMPGGEVSKSAEKMFSQYSAIMAEIAVAQPALARSDWGISMSESGELEVTGRLSDDEKSLIAEKFNRDAEFVGAARDFKSSFLKYLDMGVGGWSDYDVNEHNFSKVIDFKELLDNSQGGEDFKKAWNKDFSWLGLGDSVSSQIKRNAEKK